MKKNKIILGLLPILIMLLFTKCTNTGTNNKNTKDTNPNRTASDAYDDTLNYYFPNVYFSVSTNKSSCNTNFSFLQRISFATSGIIPAGYTAYVKVNNDAAEYGLKINGTAMVPVCSPINIPGNGTGNISTTLKFYMKDPSGTVTLIDTRTETSITAPNTTTKVANDYFEYIGNPLYKWSRKPPFDPTDINKTPCGDPCLLLQNVNGVITPIVIWPPTYQ